MNQRYISLFASILILAVGCTKKNSSSPVAEDPVKRLEDAIAKNPSYENYISLGLELANKGKADDALAAYRKATEINPKAPLAWNNICAELNGQGKFGEALPSCEKAVEMDGNFVLAKNNLEFARKKLMESREGLLKRKQALLAGDKKVSADLLNLGMDFFNMKDYESANDLWKAIRKDDALYASAQNNIASSLIVTNKFDAAERALGEALAREPNNQLFKNNKSWLEQKRKEAH